MSAENLGRQLNNLVGQADGALVTVDGFTNWLLGTSVPGAVAGHEVGSLFLKLDGGIGSSLYVNEGSRTVADFNAITTGALVNDTTPQLGGMLDVNGNAIGDGTLELLAFIETASAINEITITNAAIGNGPSLTATGDDTNIDLVLDAKGSGIVQILASAFTVTAGDVTATLGDIICTAGDISNTLGDIVAVAGTICNNVQSSTGDGTTTLDWGAGNNYNFTFGAQNETFTFTAPAQSCDIYLSLLQDSVGSRTVTWPAAVKWAGGSAPTLTTTATTGEDIIHFYFDGTSYHGSVHVAATA